MLQLKCLSNERAGSCSRLTPECPIAPHAVPPASSWRQYRFHVDEGDYEVMVTAVVEGEASGAAGAGSIDMFLKAEQPAGARARAGGAVSMGLTGC